jgi:hypothetical protein
MKVGSGSIDFCVASLIQLLMFVELTASSEEVTRLLSGLCFVFILPGSTKP